MDDYQGSVDRWMQQCFGAQISADQTERAFRFLEEALELAQALNVSRDEAIVLVDYVFGRPPGAPNQEVGGVMVTLAALCNALVLDMDGCGVVELARCNENTDKIRAKHAAKPVGVRTALPGLRPISARPDQSAEGERHE